MKLKYYWVFNEDFLKWNPNMKFDVIIGNPPYQGGVGNGSKKLYPYFIKKSIELLKENGFLLFVTPNSAIEMLLGNTSRSIKIDKQYQIHHISVNTPGRFFKVGSSFCYFVLEKVERYNKKINLEFYDENNNIKNEIVEINNFLPERISKIDFGIISKVFSNKNEMNTTNSRIERDSKTGEKINVITIMNSKRGIIESSYIGKKHKNYNKPKVIFPQYYYTDVFYNDYKGEKFNGLGSNFYICTSGKKQNDNLIKFTKSKLVKHIMKYKSSTNTELYFVLRNIKKIDLDMEMTDEEIIKNQKKNLYMI